MLFKSCTLLALASSALASLSMTSPTATSTFNGGSPASINWQANSEAPTLEEFGNARVSVYVGNAQQQTLLQTISESVNVATTASIQFTPDPSIGPNSNEYFIRVESLQARDPKNPQFPALAFSSKFTLANMRGTFNATVLAQLAGQSTAPLAGQPTTGQSTTGQSTAGQTTSRSTTATSTGTSTVSRSTGTQSASNSTQTNTNNSGALSVGAGWASVFLSVFVGVAAL